MSLFIDPRDTNDPDYDAWGDEEAWHAYDEWERAEFDVVETPTCLEFSADLWPVVTVADALEAIDRSTTNQPNQPRQ